MKPSGQTQHFAWFAMVLVISVALRFYNLGNLPPRLYIDEAMYGIDAAKTLATKHFPIFYTDNNGRGAFYITSIAMMFSAFGVKLYTLRATSAVCGVLSLLYAYLLGLELWPNNKSRHSIALMGMWLLGVSYWHLNFSRIAFDGITTPMLQTACLWLLFKGLNQNNTRMFMMAGAVCAIGFYSYIAYWAVLPVIAVIIAHAWIMKKITWRCILTFAIPALLIALPLAIYILHYPELFFMRAQEVNIFGDQAVLKEFMVNTGKTIAMLFYKGDDNLRHNYHMLPELSVLAMIGLVGAIKLPRRVVTPQTQDALWPLVLWACFTALPEIVSNERIPHALRAIGMVVPLNMLAAYGLIRVWNYLYGRFQHTSTKAMIKAMIACLLLGQLLCTFYTYFFLFAHEPNLMKNFDPQGQVFPPQNYNKQHVEF